jgi:hypothetical protein
LIRPWDFYRCLGLDFLGTYETMFLLFLFGMVLRGVLDKGFVLSLARDDVTGCRPRFCS